MYFIIMGPIKNSQRFIGQDPASNSGVLDEDFQQMRPIFQKNYDRWLPVSRDASILDFGCGYGTFLRYLNKNGFTRLRGIDPDPRCFAAAKKNCQAELDNSANTLAYLEKNPAAFDFIASFRVANYFEREEILAYFSALRTALKEGGRLLLEVNNSAPLTGSIEFIQDPFYKSQYSDVSLRDILTASGFEIEYMGGLDLPSKGIRRILWLAAQRIWHRVLKIIYILEQGAIERNPRIFHSHIVVVARPRREVLD